MSKPIPTEYDDLVQGKLHGTVLKIMKDGEEAYLAVAGAEELKQAIEAAEQKALQDGYTMGWGDRVRNDARTPEEAYEEWKQEQGEGLTTK